MTLQKRTALVVAAPLFLLAVALYYLFDAVLLQQFEQIEQSRMYENVQRVNGAMESTKKTLIAKTIDWAQWDDTYQFIDDHNAKYISSILNYETLAALQMRHVAYVNPKGTVVEAFKILPEEETVVAIPSEELSVLLKNQSLFKHSSVDDSVSGFLWLDKELVLIAGIPISDSKREKPIKGTLVFTQLLSSEFIQAVGSQTRLDVTGLALNGQGLADTKDQAGYDKAMNNNGTGILAPTEELIFGYGLIRDLSDQPAMLLKTKQKREIYQQGLAFRGFLLGFILVAIMLTMVSMFAFLHRSVLSRFASLTTRLRDISISKDTSIQIPELGKDELGQLALDVNEMLCALHKSKVETEKAKRTAEIANQAKSTFIAKVSHELRTPIASITGMHRMIMKKEQSRAIRELIKVADDAAWGLLDIINEILDFSKAESGNLTVEKIPFDLRKIVRETTQTVSGRMADKEQLDFVCDVAPSVPAEIVSDPTKIRQILMNLLGNSIKFTQSGHVGLRISAEQSLPHQQILKIAVGDTGIGIPADKIETIFEPFRQVDESVTRRFQGTGLGLSIVKQFAEALGGSITVNSVENQGATFNIRIPVGITAEAGQKQRGALPKVLIFNDALPSTETLINGVKERGIELQSASADSIQSLPEALKLCADFDLVVLTEKAASASFILELVNKLSVRPNQRTVAILKTSKLELRELLYAKGINAILSTPVIADDLIDCWSETKVEQPSLSASLNSIAPAAKKLRVLIADDAATNRIILEDILLDAGHEVVAVNDGQAALDKLIPMLNGAGNAEHFDILLTDVSMPIVDGYTVTQTIRSVESQKGGTLHLPILAVTAHAMSAELNRMREAGVDGVITKPLKPESVAAEMERCMRAKG